MSPRNNEIPGLASPVRGQAEQLAMAWERDTAPDRLRLRQLAVLAVVVVLGVLRALGGTVSAGIGTGLVALVVFSPLQLLWKGMIRKIRKRAKLLYEGRFQLAPVECLTARPNRWYRHYVGMAVVRLQNGTILKRTQMPYYLAKRLCCRREPTPAWLVMIEGEYFPVIFER